MRITRTIGLIALALLAISCDAGPDGPGDIVGSVTSPGAPLGGVVMEVVGGGVEGFSGAGGTKLFWAPQSTQNVYRVVVIGESGSDLEFTVSVKDRGGRMPRATVVGAVDLQNLPLPVTEGFKVRFKE